MNSAPSSAATNAPARNWSSHTASAVPTRTGATAAGRVRTRAAITQMRTGESGTARELREVRRALLLVGLAALLGLVGGVEEEVGVVGQLLDAAQAVLGGVEAGLQQPQREGGEGQHLATPGDGLGLQVLQRHDRVHQAHL